MDIDKLVNEVIPPCDYQHRNGFNNKPIIDKLSENEKLLLENVLIQKLKSEIEKDIDTLIVETLAYLKSRQALPTLYHLLEISDIDEVKLEIAAHIFEVNQDEKMVEIAIDCFNKIAKRTDAYHVYAVSGAFNYLTKFKNEKIKKLIKEYSSHPDYLISYNAKKALGA